MLALFPRTPKVVGAAGLLIAATFISVRANIVVPGLVLPELRGLERAYTDPRLTFTYVPSTFEFLVGLFVVAFGVALFFIGYWLLPITRGHDLERADGELPARGEQPARELTYVAP